MARGDVSVDSPARDQLAAVRSRVISARELLQLHLARIEQRNPELNAIVALGAARGQAAAAQADELLAGGAEVGALHGLPFAFKDTRSVAGWLSTRGSSLFADHVPDDDDLIVSRIRNAGVVVVGKTNVPEFAAGSHTFNEVYGVTRNPVDPSRSAGGSSGGAASALGSGMLALADGSDMGGSLRNPASLCGVVGLRPSLGRVPEWPSLNLWEAMSVSGPMARDVRDCALLLSVMAGPDPHVPQALAEPGEVFAAPLVASLKGVEVAVSPDLAGMTPVDPEIVQVVEEAAHVMVRAGAEVRSALPDLREAEDTFRTLRAWHLHAELGALHRAHPGALKPSLATNLELGASLSGDDVARAYAGRSRLTDRLRRFFCDHDLLVMPSAAVPAFPAELEYPTDIAGTATTDYLDWMRTSYLISTTGCPAISIPAGRTRDGLPVGVQLVAAHGRDRFLLECAAALEDAL